MSKQKSPSSDKHTGHPDKKTLLRLYERMALIRRFESVAQELNKKGVWPGFLHLYIGEEAVAVGVCDHLRPEDRITSTHRGHGHALAKGVPAKSLMAELYGKATGCSGGRGGSMHMYALSEGLLGTSGIVASGIPLAVGAGLSAQVRGTDEVGVSFFGDGASNHASFLESLNFATVQKLPVILVCENNLYATATPLRRATANTDIASKAAAFGCAGVAVDGNDVLAVWTVARDAIARARAGGGPTLIEARTYRWCGHHEGDPVTGTYRTKEEVELWKARCPLDQMRKRMVDEWRVATKADIAAIEERVAQEVKDAVTFGEDSPVPDTSTLYHHVFASPLNPPIPAPSDPTDVVTQGWLEAVRDGIAEEMRRNKNTVVLGEGIGERGGCFGHTKDLWKEFGDLRVRDTPISELSFTGASIGASATGCRAIADMMFSDFLFEAASQIIHQAAKLRYMSNGQVGVPVILRAPIGMIKCAGAHHSGSYYPMWAHEPGLIIVVPSDPAEAKGLMKTALRASDPVLFMEHKALFATKGLVPRGETLIPFGQARIVRSGTDLTMVTCGLLMHRCLEAAAALESRGVSCEIIDLRTIVPLDVETIEYSVRKTGRLLVVDEAWSAFGVGAEVTAAMMERGFDYLDAPVGRLHTEPVPFPFSAVLERLVEVTTEKIVSAAERTLGGWTPGHRSLRPQGNAEKPAAMRPMPAVVAAQSSRPMPPPVAPVPVSVAPRVAPVVSVPLPVATAPVAPKVTKATPVEGGVPVVMPNMDLTISEAKVVRWLKKVGDAVKEGEAIVEIETEKAVVEVESTAGGIVVQLLVAEGDVIPFGQPLAIVKKG